MAFATGGGASQGSVPRAAGRRGEGRALVAEIASEILKGKERLAALDARLRVWRIELCARVSVRV